MKPTAQVLTLLLGITTFLSGCVYKVPLTEACSIPINEEVLGVWIEEEDIGKPGEDRNGIHVLRFSPTEYLILLMDDELDDPVILRGYPIKIGGMPLVQIELPRGPEDHEEQRFHVARYAVTNQQLHLSLLNKQIINENIQSSEELKQAFLENLEHPDLFEESGIYVHEKLNGGGK